MAHEILQGLHVRFRTSAFNSRGRYILDEHLVEADDHEFSIMMTVHIAGDPAFL